MRKVVFVLLWGLVFIIPWEGIFVVEEFATMARLLGAGVFGAAIVAVVASASLRRLSAGFIPLTAFVLWSCLTLAWTIVPEESMVRAETYLLLLTMVWLIWEFAPSLKAQRSLMWAFVLGCSMIMVAVYVQFFLGEDVPGMRYAAPSTNPNGVALCAIFVICFLLYVMNTLGRGLRIASWCSIFACGLAALLTGSRSGIGGLLICALLSLASFRRIGWGQALAILFCVLGVWFLVPQGVVEQLAVRVGQSERSRAFEVRQEAWVAGLRTWELNPLLGVGAGSYPTASERGGGPPLVAHNTFIEVLVEDGVIGLGIFLVMCLTFLRLVWRMPPRERGLWITLLGSFGPNWVVGSVEYFKDTWLIFALILAQSGAFRRAQLPGAGRARAAAAEATPVEKRHAG